MTTLEVAVADLLAVQLPPPCVCCDAPPVTSHVLRATTQDGWQLVLELIGIVALPPFVDLGSSSEHVLRVPVCATCARHVRWARRTAIALVVAVVPVFLGAGVAITVAGASNEWYPPARVLWPAVLGTTALVLACLWLALLALAPRTASCTTRRRPVRVRGFGFSGVVRLRFTSPAAARRCLERNRDLVRARG